MDNKQAYLSMMYTSVCELESSDGTEIILGFYDSIDRNALERLEGYDSDGIEVSQIDILNNRLELKESYKNCEISRVLSNNRGSASDSSYFVVLREEEHLITITDFHGRHIDINIKDTSLVGRGFILEDVVSLFEDQDDYVLIEGESEGQDVYNIVNIVLDMSKSAIIHSYRDHRDSVESETNKHRLVNEYTDISGDTLLRFNCNDAIYIAFAGGHYLKFTRYGKYISSSRFESIVDLINNIKPNVTYIDNEYYSHTDSFKCRGFLDTGASIFKEYGDKYQELQNIKDVVHQHILPDIRFTDTADGNIRLYNESGEQIELTNSLGLHNNIKYSVDFGNALRLLKFEYNHSDREKTTAELIAIIGSSLMYICEIYRDSDGLVKQADLRYYKNIEYDRNKAMQFRVAESLTDGRPVVMIRSDSEVSIIDLFNKNGSTVKSNMTAYLEDNHAIYEKDIDEGEQVERFIDIQLGYNQYELDRENFSLIMQDSDEYLDQMQDNQD